MYPGYPPPSQPYPPQPGYPPSGYPPAPAPAGYPPAAPGYPPAPAGYPPAPSGYPPAAPGYPPAPSGYPAAAPGYPPAPPSQPYGQAPPQPQPFGQQGNPPVGFVMPPQLPQGYNSAPAAQPYGAPPYGAPQPPTPYQNSAPYPGGPSPQPPQPYYEQSNPYPQQPAGYGAPPLPPKPQSAAPPPPAPYSGGSYPSGGSMYPSGNPSYPPASGQMPGGGNLYSAAAPNTTPIVMQEVDIKAPSIKYVPNFNAQQDCEVLRKAMKGIGTDEAALIEVLCKRNWEQRAEIERTFKQMFGKDLEKEITGETGGNFRKVLQRLLKTPTELAAYELREAIEGAGTDEEALIEIICTKTNAELEAIKQKYHQMYNRNLEKDVAGDTGGHFRRLLVALLSASRNENPKVDWNAASTDARALYEAGEKKVGTDESRFNVVLCSRSYPHLRAVFEAYKREFHKDIDQVIRSEFSGDVAKGLLAVVSVVRNKQAYFANRLHSSIAGAGTRDTMLIRIVVSRCDVDLLAIKGEYQQLYAKPLARAIAEDCSGDYKKALIALLGD